MRGAHVLAEHLPHALRVVLVLDELQARRVLGRSKGRSSSARRSAEQRPGAGREGVDLLRRGVEAEPAAESPGSSRARAPVKEERDGEGLASVCHGGSVSALQRDDVEEKGEPDQREEEDHVLRSTIPRTMGLKWVMKLKLEMASETPTGRNPSRKPVKPL
jgi:hypothetical protein